MDLHQLQITYLAEEDRILMRLSFRSDAGALQEIRAWLTRRLVNNLWPGIVRALETQIKLDQPQAAHASAELVGMEHQESVTAIKARGDFNIPFEETVQAFPPDGTPLLVTAAQFTINARQPVRINFTPTNGDGFEVALTQDVLHAFCTLLQEAVKTAEWGIDLRLPVAATDADGPRVLN